MPVSYKPAASDGNVAALLEQIRDQEPDAYRAISIDTEIADASGSQLTISLPTLSAGTVSIGRINFLDGSNYNIQSAVSGDDILTMFETLYPGAVISSLDSPLVSGSVITATGDLTPDWAAFVASYSTLFSPTPGADFEIADFQNNGSGSAVYSAAAGKSITVPAFTQLSIHPFGTEGVTFDVVAGEAGKEVDPQEGFDFDPIDDGYYEGVIINVPAGAKARAAGTGLPETPFNMTVT